MLKVDVTWAHCQPTSQDDDVAVFSVYKAWADAHICSASEVLRGAGASNADVSLVGMPGDDLLKGNRSRRNSLFRLLLLRLWPRPLPTLHILPQGLHEVQTWLQTALNEPTNVACSYNTKL